MTTDALFSIIKIVSTISTAIFGVLTLLRDNKDKNTGQLTKWGRITISGIFLSATLALSLQALESAKAKNSAIKSKETSDSMIRLLSTILQKSDTTLSQQKISLNKTQTISLAMDSNLISLKLATKLSGAIMLSMDSSLDQQHMLYIEQKKNHLLTLSEGYPLEPITFFYEKEYSMDLDWLKAYTNRVQHDIVTYLRTEREGRGITSDDLHDENVIFLLSNEPEWLPQDSLNERTAIFELLRDETSFSFKKSDQEIMFNSLPTGREEIFVRLPEKAKLKQKLILCANFKKRVFIKQVRCDNPMRNGNDITSKSAVDLIGRKMELSYNDNYSTVTQVGIRFQYDYDDENIRYIIIPEKNKAVLVSAKDIGLKGLIPQ